MSKPFADIGNFTTFPNEIIDTIMPKCAPNTWKILCATIRKTIGWQKKEDYISISQYMTLTGIKNRRTCTKAITDAKDSGYLVRTPYRNGFKYALNTHYELGSTETVLSGSTETVPVNSTETVPTKEIVKETTTKENNKPSVYPMMQAIAKVTESDLKIKDIKGRISKDAKQLSEAGYTPQQVTTIYSRGGVWWKEDWRGKKGQRPEIPQIVQTIKRLSTVKQGGWQDYDPATAPEGYFDN